jgi:hypothetical protein
MGEFPDIVQFGMGAFELAVAGQTIGDDDAAHARGQGRDQTEGRGLMIEIPGINNHASVIKKEGGYLLQHILCTLK